MSSNAINNNVIYLVKIPRPESDFSVSGEAGGSERVVAKKNVGAKNWFDALGNARGVSPAEVILVLASGWVVVKLWPKKDENAFMKSNATVLSDFL